MFQIQEKWNLSGRQIEEYECKQETKEDILWYIKDLIDRLQENGKGLIMEINSNNETYAQVVINRGQRKKDLGDLLVYR